MQAEAPDEASAEEHEKARIPRDRPLGVIHSGNRYAFGYGPDFYGIWDAAASGPPSEQFPATDQGRQAGWRRYTELEPSAAGTASMAENPDQVWRREVEEDRTRRRRRTLIVLVVVVVVVAGGITAAALFSGGGTKAAVTELSSAAKAKKAHIEITGATPITEDLTQTDFTSVPIGSLIGGSNKGVWKGATVELTIDMHDPVQATVTTTQVGTTRTLTIDITKPDGTTVSLFSAHGECRITMDSVSDAGFSGSFDCTGLSAGTETVDAKGMFGASGPST